MNRAQAAAALAVVAVVSGVVGFALGQGPQAHESVICKRGQGKGGEYMHFRRATKGLDRQACEDALTAYTEHFPMVGALYCSPTPHCPDE